MEPTSNPHEPPSPDQAMHPCNKRLKGGTRCAQPAYLVRGKHSSGCVDHICGAKLRGERKGQLCPNWPLRGKPRCRMHRGGGEVGAANSNYKHGAFSRVLETLGMREGYEARISDPNLTSLRDQLGLLDVRLIQLLSQIPEGSAGGVSAARKHLAEYRAAIGVRDAAAMQSSLAALETALDRAASEESAWNKILKTAAERRKTAAAETMTMNRLNQFMTQEQVGTLNLAVYQSLNSRLLTLIHELGVDAKYHRQVMDGVGQDIRRLLLESEVCEAEFREVKTHGPA